MRSDLSANASTRLTLNRNVLTTIVWIDIERSADIRVPRSGFDGS